MRPSIEGLNCTVTPFQLVLKYFKRRQHFFDPGECDYAHSSMGTKKRRMRVRKKSGETRPCIWSNDDLRIWMAGMAKSWITCDGNTIFLQRRLLFCRQIYSSRQGMWRIHSGRRQGNQWPRVKDSYSHRSVMVICVWRRGSKITSLDHKWDDTIDAFHSCNKFNINWKMKNQTSWCGFLSVFVRNMYWSCEPMHITADISWKKTIQASKFSNKHGCIG